MSGILTFLAAWEHTPVLLLILAGACLILALLLAWQLSTASGLRWRLAINCQDIEKVEALQEEAQRQLQDQIAKGEEEMRRSLKALGEKDSIIARQEERIQSLEHERSDLIREKQEIRGEIERMRTSLREEFALMAGRELAEAGRQLEMASERRFRSLLEPVTMKLGGLISPLRDNISGLGEELRRSNDNSLVLRKSIQDVISSQARLSQEADSLADALRGSKTQGCWGEMLLERCLESMGLREHAEFDREVFFRGTERSFRPDAVLHLPGEQEVIIDAKCPLNAYAASSRETDPERRESLLRQHVEHIRHHISALGERRYHELPQLQGRVWDFVLLFLPSDGMLSCCAATLPELLEFASSRHVVLTTPSTLMACLMMVRLLWRDHTRAGTYAAAEASFRDFQGAVERVLKKFEDADRSYAVLGGKIGDLRKELLLSRKSLIRETSAVRSFLGIRDPREQGEMDQPDDADGAGRSQCLPRGPEQIGAQGADPGSADQDAHQGAGAYTGAQKETGARALIG